MRVGRPQPPDQVGARAIHRQLIEVAGAVAGGHQHDVRAFRPHQALGQGLSDQRGGEILVFQVDRTSRAQDRGQVQVLDLGHLRLTAPGRFGAGHGDVHVLHVRRQPHRPVVGGLHVRRRGDGVPRRPHPADAGQIAQHSGGRSVDHHHDLVPRRVMAAAGHHPARVSVEVRRRVPAVRAEVEAAAHRHLVVDDQHLLVMARPIGDAGVQQEADRTAVEPSPRPVGEELLGGADRQGRLPDQDADVEFGALGSQSLQHISDLVVGVFHIVGIGLEARPGVEAPAQQKDRSPRLADGRDGGCEDRRPVRQETDPSGARRPPAPGRRQQSRGVAWVDAFAAHRAAVPRAIRLARSVALSPSPPPSSRPRAYRRRR